MKAKIKLLAIYPVFFVIILSAISIYTGKAFVEGALTQSDQTFIDTSNYDSSLEQSDFTEEDAPNTRYDMSDSKTTVNKSEATSNKSATNSNESSDQESVSGTPSSTGQVTTTYCSGNYSIPEGVCKTLVKVKQNPTASNNLIIGSARTKLASLPKAQSLSYNEANWLKITSATGTIRVVAKTSLGTTLMFATLEKRSNTWYITDIIF